MHTRLKRVRLEALPGKKLTQTEFAEMLSTTRPAIAAYEGGSVVPKPSFIDLVCKTFRVSREWLETGEGEMTVPTTADDRIYEFVSEALADKPDGIKYMVMQALAGLDDDGWEALAVLQEKFLKK